MPKRFTSPPPIYVFVTVNPNKNNGLKEPYTARVGTCQTPVEISALVASDLTEMGDTFGGLFEPVSKKGRVYRAFRAEWTELRFGRVMQ